MDLTGLCDICGRPGKLFTCMLCGKRVCIACFALNRGLCKNCLSGKARDKPDTLK